MPAGVPKRGLFITYERIAKLDSLGLVWNRPPPDYGGLDLSGAPESLPLISNKKNATGFVGVKRTKQGYFSARIKHQQKDIYLGTFDTPEEAALVVAKAKWYLESKTATLSKVAERKISELKRYKEEHGHLNISQVGATEKLYKWLHRRKNQRDDFLAGKKVALTQEEFDRLNELGVDWSIGNQTNNPTQ